MSIVTIHGPYTFGSKAITEVGPAIATVNPANGLIWTFKLDQPSTRTASLAWTFPTGTPASATGPGPHAVTFGSAGSKAVTAVATGAGEGANPYPPAGTTNIPVTAVAGVAPRSLMSGEGEGDEELIPAPAPDGFPVEQEDEITEEVPVTSSEPYDPASHTVSEVQTYTAEHPDELEAIYEAEVAGKNRTSLVTWLENQFPYDPGEWTVSEVLDYAAENPGELEDIITSEQAGKNRSTLVSQLEAMR